MILSIITVCLNDASNLKKTIESIPLINEVEVIVMDGGSTDGSLEYLKNTTRPHFRFFSQPDSGIYDAMNKAFAQSHGKYVYFLNAGDTLVEGALEKVISILKARTLDLLYGKVQCKDSDVTYLKGALTHSKDFKWGMPISHQAIFYRRGILPAIPYDIRFRLIADYLLTRKLFEMPLKIVFWDQLIANFDLTGISSTSHFKILKERLSAAKEQKRYAEIFLVYFVLYPKYLLIALLNKLKVYEYLRRWRHT